VINGTVNADNLLGTAANDTINGLAGNDTINGAAGNDAINGGAGNDDLNGGTGVDALTGGTGADTFRFDANGPANSDQITDFNIAEGDRIALAASVFTDIGNAGAGLTAAQFLAGPGVVSATSRAQRILFNTTTGALFWDVDGSRNNNAPIQFATVNPVAALTNTQFILV
jgi:Ca2+-binding RTX toxin-like protein